MYRESWKRMTSDTTQTLNLNRLFNDNDTISFNKGDFAKKFPSVRTGVEEYKKNSELFSGALKLKNEELTKIKEDTKLEIGKDNKSYKDLFGSVASVGQSYFLDDDFGKILSILFDKEHKKFILDKGKITEIEKYFSNKKVQKKNNKAPKRYATPNAATCRLLMALFPNNFCPIPTPNKVDSLINKLIHDEYLKKGEIKKLRNECKGWLIRWCVFNNVLYQIFNVGEEQSKGVSPWDAIVRYGGEEQRKEIKNLLQENYNLILTGAPGTGKTYRAKEIAVEMTKTNTNLQNLSSDIEEAFIVLKKQGYADFVQFHPSYDYTDFVEGLRPKASVDGFERKDGIFKAFCAKAANDTNKNKYVIIIDEINRGEISKIFGELFFSIDPGYRGEKGKVDTQYQNLIKNDEKMPDDPSKEYPFINGFYVPENVFIIGTMNDIDRSVESMDFAFRRRFAFKEIKAEDSKAMLWDGDNYQVLEDVIDRVNKELIKTQYGLSEAYQIGASYFNKIKKTNCKSEYDYSKELKELWEYHIKGLLYEYLRGKPNAFVLLDQLKNSYFGKEPNTEEGQEIEDNVNDTQG